MTCDFDSLLVDRPHREQHEQRNGILPPNMSWRLTRRPEDEKYRCFINRYLTLEVPWAVLDRGR